jgi:hypothetical protein
VAAIIILALWGFEYLLTVLWKTDSPKLFSVIGLKDILHAIDLVMLILIGTLGVVSFGLAIYKSMKE